MTASSRFECDGLVISKKATEKLGEGIQNTPVGTGPYVATLVPNKSLTYRRFAGWNAHWDRPVYWKGINYVLAGTVPSGQSTLVPLQAGAVQIDPLPTQTDLEQLKGNTNFRTYEAPSLATTFLGLNVQYPALRDIRVRQAIRYALDVPGILKIVGLPPSTQAYTFTDGYPSNYQWPEAPHYDQDIAKAKSLLNAAGASDLHLVLYNGPYPAAPGLAEAIQANLASVGIKISILAPDAAPADWFSNPKASQLTINSNGLGSGGPDPASQLLWFTCNQIGVFNQSQWCDQRYSNLYIQLNLTSNTSERASMVREMNQLLDQSAAFIYLYHPPSAYASSHDVDMVFDPAADFWPTWSRPINA